MSVFCDDRLEGFVLHGRPRVSAAVWLDLLPDNQRIAKHLYESSGFTFERTIEGAHPSPDGPLDLLVMSIRRDAWESQCVGISSTGG